MKRIRITLHYYVTIGLANNGYRITNSKMTYLSLICIYTISAYMFDVLTYTIADNIFGPIYAHTKKEKALPPSYPTREPQIPPL